MIRKTDVPASAAAVLLLVAALTRPAFAAGLEASVDTPRPSLGQSFTLTLTVEDADTVLDETPDLSPLASDFDVLRTGTSNRTRIVNGERTDSRSWIVTLAPKTTGRLTIPPIAIGEATSEPIIIDVGEAPAVTSDASRQRGIGMELLAEEGTRHEHEEIPLTLRIVDALGMRDARLAEPDGEDFTLVQVGEDETRLVESRGGTPLRVIERRYVLKPHRGGTLTVPPITLQARVSDPSSRRSPFAGTGLPDGFGPSFGGSLFDDGFFDDFFDRGREVVVRTEPLTIDVLARPDTVEGWFLPARNVELEDDWEERAPTLRVGEAATRTIRLVALGASAEQLPDLALGDPDGVRLYVDRTRDRSIDTPDGTAAVREIDVSVVPTRAGETTLPAVELSWWDTDADAERVATLPARTVDVTPGSGAGEVGTGAAAAGAAASASGDPSLNAIDRSGSRDAVTSSLSARARSDTVVLVALVVLGACGAALAFVVTRLLRRGRHGQRADDAEVRRFGRPRDGRAPSGDTGGASAARRALARDVTAACRANDPRRAYRAFGDWLRAVDPGRSVSVADIAPVSPPLADALAALESRVFADGADGGWDGERFRRAFEDGRRRFGGDTATGRGPSDGPLPTLYPSRDRACTSGT